MNWTSKLIISTSNSDLKFLKESEVTSTWFKDFLFFNCSLAFQSKYSLHIRMGKEGEVESGLHRVIGQIFQVWKACIHKCMRTQSSFLWFFPLVMNLFMFDFCKIAAEHKPRPLRCSVR